MNIEELFIGAYVKYRDKICKICGITDVDVDLYSDELLSINTKIEDIDPIYMDGSWIKKLNMPELIGDSMFIKYGLGPNWEILHIPYINLWQFNGTTIKYVHTVQMLKLLSENLQ